jgi:hypothetical protein
VHEQSGSSLRGRNSSAAAPKIRRVVHRRFNSGRKPNNLCVIAGDEGQAFHRLLIYHSPQSTRVRLHHRRSRFHRHVLSQLPDDHFNVQPGRLRHVDLGPRFFGNFEPVLLGLHTVSARRQQGNRVASRVLRRDCFRFAARFVDGNHFGAHYHRAAAVDNAPCQRPGGSALRPRHEGKRKSQEQASK